MKNDFTHSHKPGFPPLLHLTYHLQHLADDRLSERAGIGISQARIMSALGSSPTSQRAVALALHQTEANVSRQLKVMKKAGLVHITKNKKDARQRDVTLTHKGLADYAKAEELLAEMEKSFERQIKQLYEKDRRSLGL